MKTSTLTFLIIVTLYVGRGEASEPIIDVELGVVIADFGCPWEQDEHGDYQVNRQNLNFFVANYTQILLAQSAPSRLPIEESAKERVQGALLTFVHPFDEPTEDDKSPLQIALSLGLKKCIFPGVERFAPEDKGIKDDMKVVWFLEQFIKPRSFTSNIKSFFTDRPFRDRQNAIFKADPEFEKKYLQWADVAWPLIRMISDNQLELDLEGATNTIALYAASVELMMLTSYGLGMVKTIPIIGTRTADLSPAFREAVIGFFATAVALNVVEAPKLVAAIENHEFNEKSIMRVVIDHEWRIIVISGVLTGAASAFVAIVEYGIGAVAQRAILDALPDDTFNAVLQLQKLSAASGH